MNFFTLPPEVLRLRLDRLRRLVQRLNFSSEFHFSRFFHRGAGMSPTQFRERSRA